MKVIITMAGLGTRFRNKGYRKEKHEILFHGQTLFEWAVGSLENFRDSEFIFITRDFTNIEEFIRERAKRLGLKTIQIEIINHLTRGQAETALLAGKFFKKDDSVIIYNTDTYVRPNMLHPGQIRGNGWIPVFSAPGDKWSFVEANKDEIVLRTTEKIRTSDNCSIGLYYFDSFRKFEKLVTGYEAKSNIEKSKEWYIAPLYNEFIREGNKVYMQKIPSNAVMVLGTPEDLINAENILCNKIG